MVKNKQANTIEYTKAGVPGQKVKAIRGEDTTQAEGEETSWPALLMGKGGAYLLLALLNTMKEECKQEQREKG